MKFKKPKDLAVLDLAALRALLAEAEAEFDELSAAVKDDGATVTAEQLETLQALNAAADEINSRIGEVEAEDAARAASARELIAARTARTQTTDTGETEETDDTDEGGDGGAEVVAEAEQVAAEAVTEQQAVTASSARPVNFRGLGSRRGTTATPPAQEIGWRMRPQTPRFVDGPVGFQELAASIDSMSVGARITSNRPPHRDRANMIPMSLATLDRGFTERDIITADTEEDYRRQLADAVARTPWRKSQFDSTGALVASGGHCAVPETIYEFCEIVPASGLLTLPAVNFGPRGGQRRPLLPDFSELYATLPFRFTEEELQAVDGSGNPTAIKPCVEIPCPEWEEIYVEAIGLCVTAGILQRRGFPEAIARYLQEVTKAHLTKVSVWSILDMVAKSNSYTIPTSGGIGAAGAMLSGWSLRATMIRQQEGLPPDAIIEGVAPSWALDVAKADMGFQQGVDVKAVTDAQIDGWLATNSIQMQWVKHWQDMPSASVRWPASVSALLYPAGAFVQHLQNVIEIGTLYDKTMLQQNRYMELFTEDEYAIDKRCRVSEFVTVSTNASGSVGAREQITVASFTNEVQTVGITGSPTGGTYTLTFRGQTTDPLAYNATPATVATALQGLSTIGTGNVAVAGTAASYTVTFQALLGGTNVPAITAAGSFTGGSSPAIAVAQTTAGAPN